jgi:hypothetical protein
MPAGAAAGGDLSAQAAQMVQVDSTSDAERVRRVAEAVASARSPLHTSSS